ncbi:flagellar assembly protein FliX [Blastochloris viridis]|uniref:Flagellar assembly protein fliX n=1 Tax=Blastochloris viridis TaxID=1079 RepID=A0A0H5BA61_BLAVI|nr:flagellar assembly protein FliX [Blastochloris viridis]ALK08784.1 Flagellar assembly protein FliX [Blastochloris viridis]BAR97919.1 flagellar trans-acting factor FliX [Blastochloris viridis]CUU41445.1 Flagellar assembly protein fliX [Blastochloris viridis]
MLIVGPRKTGNVTTTNGARQARGGSAASFSLEDSAAVSESIKTSAVAVTQSLDALLMVQESDPRERRRRAVARSRQALDLLDEMKLALIAGESIGPALARLETAAAALREQTGEPGLDSVIDAIDLRVAVELAKRGRTVQR